MLGAMLFFGVLVVFLLNCDVSNQPVNNSARDNFEECNRLHNEIIDPTKFYLPQNDYYKDSDI